MVGSFTLIDSTVETVLAFNQCVCWQFWSNKRRWKSLAICFLLLHVSILHFKNGLSSALLYSWADWQKTFPYLFFFHYCCSRGMWTVPEMLGHWTVRRKLGYRLYYFVWVGVTYNVYCRKIAKASKQGYKITLEFCSSVQVTFGCVSTWNEMKYDINLY